MAYDTTEAVAKFLSGFQMEITHRGKGTFTPDHVKYSLTIANGGKDFSTTFESNPHVHGEPTITQVFGSLAEARREIPPAPTRWSSSTIPRITGSS